MTRNSVEKLCTYIYASLYAFVNARAHTQAQARAYKHTNTHLFRIIFTRVLVTQPITKGKGLSSFYRWLLFVNHLIFQ